MDTEMKTLVPAPSRFVAGKINRNQLRKMLGELRYEIQYEKKDINSDHIQKKNQINGICPVDHNHAWLSIYKHKGLVLVRKEGVVTDTVVLDFIPLRLTLVRTTDILMTSIPVSTFVYKLSLHNKQVTIFANIGSHKACDLSIHQTGEVYISTKTPDIVILNQSGAIVRKVTCTRNGIYIACTSAGIAVSSGIDYMDYIASNISIIDTSGTTLQTWSGELDNNQTASDMHLCKMSCDRYDRLFVPDLNNKVYVLPRTCTRATCLLDRKHGVVKPTALEVDTCGDVWIGCHGGTVHVIKL
ncbi:uncharacterized protein [Argopecten irradians]|uniref:uncharacterized protein n=1 Tax=Argopecten irradians TaxID=31199 RepID=UPI003718423E